MSSASGPIETAAAVCASHGNNPALLIEILHDVQEALGYVPEETLLSIAKSLNLARAEVHGVMSFYHDFRTEPAPAIVLKVCRAEACQAMAGADVLAQAQAVCAGRDDVLVEPVYCLGNCALAPAAMLNGRLIGRADGARLEQAIAEADAEAQP